MSCRVAIDQYGRIVRCGGIGDKLPWEIRESWQHTLEEAMAAVAIYGRKVAGNKFKSNES